MYDALPLIAAQLLFAYAFDMALAWWRRRPYVLGFGPFPIVFSTNLFLWFRPEWFAWQFVMLAVAFAAKSLIQWERDGRRGHVFNPSALALTVMSVGLIATGTSDATLGREIAITQFYPPHMYEFLFLVSLPGQLLFGVAPMTLAAVATTWLWGVAYFAVTGTYFFLDSDIPIAVFLGMHLLFTDPATSPRTEPGRLVFGAIYGATVVGLYALLIALGLPAFYDKLLQVPVMNLGAGRIDRLVTVVAPRWSSAGRGGTPATGGVGRRVGYACAWALAFVLIRATGGLSDDHPGQWLPFWQTACEAGRERACEHADVMSATLCRAGSGWACNELGVARSSRGGDRIGALAAWQSGCEIGYALACENARDGAARRGPPTEQDYPLLVRGSKAPVGNMPATVLHARACDLGWKEACRGEVPARFE